MVELLELSPRWTLQSLDAVVPLETKLRLCRQLRDAGFRRVEATALVAGVPQFADGPRLLAALSLEPGIWRAAAAGQDEAQAAVEAGAREVAVVALPEEMAPAVPAPAQYRMSAWVGSGAGKNDDLPRRLEAAVERTVIALRQMRPYPVRTVGAVPAAFGYPEETAGDWLPRLTEAARQLADAGADELTLVDAWGLGTPERLGLALDTLARRLPGLRLAVQPRGLPERAMASVQRAVRSGAAVLECATPLPGGREPGLAGTRQVLSWLARMGSPLDVAAPQLAKVELTLAVASSRWSRPERRGGARTREEG